LAELSVWWHVPVIWQNCLYV
jgi:hypothetical protein